MRKYERMGLGRIGLWSQLPLIPVFHQQPSPTRTACVVLMLVCCQSVWSGPINHNLPQPKGVPLGNSLHKRDLEANDGNALENLLKRYRAYKECLKLARPVYNKRGKSESTNAVPETDGTATGAGMNSGKDTSEHGSREKRLEFTRCITKDMVGLGKMTGDRSRKITIVESSGKMFERIRIGTLPGGKQGYRRMLSPSAPKRDDGYRVFIPEWVYRVLSELGIKMRPPHYWLYGT